jgi:K+-transporting ATPase ATPase A chain
MSGSISRAPRCTCCCRSASSPGLFFVWQGVPQTLGAYLHVSTLEGAPQLLARGPVASQEAIKLLSGDGGGFFNANSAHPFENPTALTGLVEMLLIFMIGTALTNTFGRMVGDERQGWVLFAVMAVMFLAGATTVYTAEAAHKPAFAALHIDEPAGASQAGGNMEGKEVRFGIGQSALFATVTTASSDGAVNAMHDSFMPASGLVLLANMMLDEVIVGGPGSGLFGIAVAVFIAGLMIGRTPEYLGKKIEANEIKMTMLVLLTVPAFILGLGAVAAVLPTGLAGLNNAGPHGFSELLYAYTSGAATNGSAFAGLNANTPFFNLTLALAMFAGRFLVIVPVLCIAGGLAAKQIVPASAGTLPTGRHAVRRTAGRHGGDCRWFDFPAGAGAWARSGALRHAGWDDLLTRSRDQHVPASKRESSRAASQDEPALARVARRTGICPRRKANRHLPASQGDDDCCTALSGMKSGFRG